LAQHAFVSHIGEYPADEANIRTEKKKAGSAAETSMARGGTGVETAKNENEAGQICIRLKE
jgi:hypothetical protein